MNKMDIKNSFRKVLLGFEADRSHVNFLKLLIAGFISLAGVVGFWIYYSSNLVLLFGILPIGLFWASIDFYRKSKNAALNLREVHNVEIGDELRKFSAKGFKKNI